MSETWNDIYLHEIKHVYIADAAQGLFGTASVLRFPWIPITSHYNLENDTDWRLAQPVFPLTTASTGAVIVDHNYSMWEFVAPDGFELTAGSTVSDVFDNLRAASIASPVSAWETFAAWFGRAGTDSMNSFITEGAAATITDALGNTYTGSQQPCTGTITSFAEFLDWIKSWCSADFLAAAASNVYATETQIACSFAFTVMGYDANLIFTFKL